MAGCVPVLSVHPLFHEDDLVFDEALLGTWVLEEGKDTLTFEKSGDRAYTLLYDQVKDGGLFLKAGEPSAFEARLVRLGSHLFLDISPARPSVTNTLYLLHTLEMHTFSRISMDGDVLRLSTLDHDRLKDMIARDDVEIAKERVASDRLVLTASTDDLQRVVLRCTEDSGAFSLQTVWDRRK